MKDKMNESVERRTKLSADELRWKCPLEFIPAETTEGVEPIEGIIGQDRALKALKLGVELNAPGYNIYVSGLSGTGKATTIKSILEKIQPYSEPPTDFVYVHDFVDPDKPLLLVFQQGEGSEFRKDVEECVELLKARIPRVYEDAEFLHSRQAIIDDYNAKEAELFSAFEERIAPEGFVFGRIEEGQSVQPEILIKRGDKTVLISDLPKLVETGEMREEEIGEYLEKYKVLRLEMQDVFRRGVHLSRDYQKLLGLHERQAVSVIVDAIFTELYERYKLPKVKDYLDRMVEFTLDNLQRFKGSSEGNGEDEFIEYKVNLLLDNKNVESCPVIIETNPTYTNVFGTIERYQDTQGFWYSDFTQIKAGSILHANGGFLVLNAVDVLLEPGVWKKLQRVLLYRKLEIQALDYQSAPTTSALKPEAIDLTIKVILVGNNEIYWLLSSYERDFKKIFKVKAEFDYEMDNTELAVQQYAALLRKLISEEKLLHFDKRAIAAIVEYGARLAGSRDKLTTRFMEIADVVREASYWCAQNSNRYVTVDHVQKAIDEFQNRHGLSEDKLQEMISRKVILIDTESERVGQINGLAVYSGDRYEFGLPSRITATVAVGEAGIINIEREAELSGSTHDKGVLILTGWLRETFAQKQPLALTASISFEQSYSGVDGDSASSTEVYALLSALSGIPIRQRYAVTGSVNQKGDIQPIGGVNEKIEGFFDVCRKRGLTGAQGVLIPVQNVSDLMLRSDIVKAVQDGRFHIHSVSRIEEGIELLTGVLAGVRGSDGQFPLDSVFGLAEKRLEEFALISSQYKGKQFIAPTDQ